jgi:hypothetical protein
LRYSISCKYSHPYPFVPSPAKKKFGEGKSIEKQGAQEHDILFFEIFSINDMKKTGHRELVSKYNIIIAQMF